MSAGEGRTIRPGRAYWILLGMYLAFVLAGSLVPLRYRFVPLDQAWQRYWTAMHEVSSRVSRSDVAANVMLFVPLTFFAMGALTRENRGGYRLLIALAVLPAAALLSASIEFVQVYSWARTASPFDIVAESVGGAIGVLLWWLFGSPVTAWGRALWARRISGRPAAKVLIVYAVALAAYHLLPLDLTLSPSEAYHKFRRGGVCVVPFADLPQVRPAKLVIKFAFMIPVGFFLAGAARERRLVLWRVAALGFLFAAGIEFLQLFVYSRYASTTDTVLGAVGAAVGAWVADCFDLAGDSARGKVNSTPDNS